jgi:hypothetical protein
MGYYEIYCFLCGNACYTQDLKDKWLMIMEIYNKTKLKNKKLPIGYSWILNYFPSLYIKFEKNEKKFYERLEKVMNDTDWIMYCTFLCADNNVVHNVHNCINTYGCNFIDEKNNIYIHNTIYENDNEMYGVNVHTDCWNCIKKEYDIELSYSCLPIIQQKKFSDKIFNFINYGKIEKYWDQFFDFLGLIRDNNDELCISPLKSSFIKNKIKKVYNKLKIRNNDIRISPIASASFYNDGMCKIGLNKNIWTIKHNKWIELKNTAEYIIDYSKFKLLKKVRYGDVNTVPVFVLHISQKKNKYVILSTSEYMQKCKML